MAQTHVPRPKLKEKNPGYAAARSGVKVDQVIGPVGGSVLPTNKTKSGGIFRATKGKIKKK